MTRRLHLTIVDDELDKSTGPGKQTRRQLYSYLNESFDICYIGRREEFYSFVKNHPTDLILLDFILERWHATALDLLDDVPYGIPVALISQHWAPNFELLRKALAKHTITTIFTWQDLADPNRRELVAFWLDNVARRKRGFSNKEPLADETFRILQISDLQFGSAGPEDIALERHMTAALVRRLCDGSPHICAISGDISEHALPSEFSEASVWLSEFVTGLDPEWEISRTLAVPGNHDVCLPLALASRVNKRLSILPAEEQVAELLPFGFQPYRDFEDSMVAEVHRFGRRHYWISSRYLQYGVIFFGYNTSAVLGSDGRPVEGADSAQLAEFTKGILHLREENPDVLLVGLFHHPLQQHSLLWPRLTTAFRGAGTVVLLTGHLHKELPSVTTSPDMSVLNIGAPTFTKSEAKRGPDTPRGCHLLELRRTADGVNGLVLRPLRFRDGQLRPGRAITYDRVNGQMIMAPIRDLDAD